MKSLILTGALAAMLLSAPLALATEPTRDDYTARVEPICKTNTEANKRIFKGARAEVKAGELKKAASHFTRATIAFAKAIKQLTAVSPPAEDKAKIDKWLGYLGDEKDLLGKIGTALKAEQKLKAQTYLVKLTTSSNLANNTVLAFGFDYCRIEPSRFS